MNSFGGTGLWDEADGFYYDRLHVDGNETALRVRSMVGLLPLIAVEVLDEEAIDRLPAFNKRLRWFLDNRRDLAGRVTLGEGGGGRMLLAIPSRERLVRVLGAHARRERVPLAARHPLDVEGVRKESLPLRLRRADAGGRLRAGRIEDRPLRRQLQLARPRLDAAQLSADRGARALPPLLRRRPARRVPRRLRARPHARRGGARAVGARGRRSSWPAPTAAAPATATTRSSPPIPTGAICCSFTSTSTARPAAASAPATRAGPTLVLRFIEDLARAQARRRLTVRSGEDVRCARRALRTPARAAPPASCRARSASSPTGCSRRSRRR